MAGGKSLTDMKIKLIRSGGFIPIKKAAEAEVSYTEEQMVRLIEIIKPASSVPKVKDGNYYELTFGKNSTPVDLEKVPEEFKELFNNLKSNLKIVK
jgi:hypothetical protein